MAILALGSDCEAVRDGLLAQPVNSLTSLAYVAAGAYVIQRRRRVVLGAAMTLVGIGSALFHGPALAGSVVAHDGSIVVLAAVILHRWWRRALPRPPVVAVGAAAAGLAVYLLTRTGAPLCRPGSLAQGHGAWHVFTAVALGAWLARPTSLRQAAVRASVASGR